jgi:glucose-1-phosphate adenylyltransferase
MGVYVFNWDVLVEQLTLDFRRSSSTRDFGKDIIPHMVDAGMDVYAYPFGGYWVDVGTVDAYWETHMDLLAQPPPFDLSDRSWIIHTRSGEYPPARIETGATVSDSLISDGCILAGGAHVERSVLSPGVYVGPDAVVYESIILNGTYIEAGATVERAIIDKDCVIGHGARVGEIIEGAKDLGIVTIGKKTHIPTDMTVRRGARIGSDLAPKDFENATVIEENAYIHSAVHPADVLSI